LQDNTYTSSHILPPKRAREQGIELTERNVGKKQPAASVAALQFLPVDKAIKIDWRGSPRTCDAIGEFLLDEPNHFAGFESSFLATTFPSVIFFYVPVGTLADGVYLTSRLAPLIPRESRDSSLSV
jgi:hypothetical protein